MGDVYKAEDTRLKRLVALKFLSRDVTGTGEHAQRFLREAQAAAGLDHPNICTVHEIDQQDGETFLAMAYLEGVPLDERIEAGPLRSPTCTRSGSRPPRGWLPRTRRASCTGKSSRPTSWSRRTGPAAQRSS